MINLIKKLGSNWVDIKWRTLHNTTMSTIIFLPAFIQLIVRITVNYKN